MHCCGCTGLFIMPNGLSQHFGIEFCRGPFKTADAPHENGRLKLFIALRDTIF